MNYPKYTKTRKPALTINEQLAHREKVSLTANEQLAHRERVSLTAKAQPIVAPVCEEIQPNATAEEVSFDTEVQTVFTFEELSAMTLDDLMAIPAARWGVTSEERIHLLKPLLDYAEALKPVEALIAEIEELKTK